MFYSLVDSFAFNSFPFEDVLLIFRFEIEIVFLRSVYFNNNKKKLTIKILWCFAWKTSWVGCAVDFFEFYIENRNAVSISTFTAISLLSLCFCFAAFFSYLIHSFQRHQLHSQRYSILFLVFFCVSKKEVTIPKNKKKQQQMQIYVFVDRNYSWIFSLFKMVRKMQITIPR